MACRKRGRLGLEPVNYHQKLPIYQLLLIFHVYLLSQGMQILLVLVVFLKNILPVLISVILKHDIFLRLEARVPLFHFLFP